MTSPEDVLAWFVLVAEPWIGYAIAAAVVAGIVVGVAFGLIGSVKGESD